jgi:hypothetical protein
MVRCLELLFYVLFNFLSSFAICRIFPHILQVCPNGVLSIFSFRVVVCKRKVPVIVWICHVALLQCSSQLTLDWEYVHILIERSCYDYRLVSYINVLYWSNHVFVCSPLGYLNNLGFVNNCCSCSDLWIILFYDCIPTPLVILLVSGIALLLPHIDFTVRHPIFVHLLHFYWLGNRLTQYCWNVLHSYIAHFITNNQQKLVVEECVKCCNRTVLL